MSVESWGVIKAAYHHKDLRNALIDEVIAMLDERGSADLTMRELARRLGVTHTAPYAHFADKRELLVAVADQGFARLADLLENARKAAPDPLGGLESQGFAYIRFAREHANLYRLMFADPEIADDPRCELSPEGERAFGALAELIATLGTPEPLVRDTTVALWAFVHGVAMLEIDRRINGKTMRSGDEIFKLGSQAFIRGLIPG